MKSFDSIDAHCQNAEYVYLYAGLGEYPPSSQVLNAMGHMAGAPCTHSLFRHGASGERPNFACATTGNCLSLPTSGKLNRALQPCAAGIREESSDYLGMKPGTVDAIQESDRLHMVKLCNELENSNI